MRPVNPHTVHEIVLAFTEAIPEIEASYSSDELATAAFRFTRHLCSSVLSQASDYEAMRQRLKQLATSLLFDLQSSKDTPIDGGPQLPLTEQES